VTRAWGVVREKLGDPNVLIIISCGFLILSLLLQIIGGIVHEVNRVPSTDEPGIGMASADAIRSVCTLPTTMTPDRPLIRLSPE